MARHGLTNDGASPANFDDNFIHAVRPVVVRRRMDTSYRSCARGAWVLCALLGTAVWSACADSGGSGPSTGAAGSGQAGSSTGSTSSTSARSGTGGGGATGSGG